MKYNVYSAIPLNASIRMQAILRSSQIGTFVGNDGRLLYRCTIEEVDYEKNNIKGRWIGREPASKRVNGWTANFIVGSNSHPKNIDRFRFNDEHHIWVPKSIQIGEEILVEEYRPDIE
jgi:hypothetical protein